MILKIVNFAPTVPVGALVCRKTFIVIKNKNGIWGEAPSRVRAVAPHSPPFLGKGGRGIGIENLLYFYKYKTFPTNCRTHCSGGCFSLCKIPAFKIINRNLYSSKMDASLKICRIFAPPHIQNRIIQQKLPICVLHDLRLYDILITSV